jgi:hypothetical protein
VIVANCLQGLTNAVRRFIQQRILPFMLPLVKTVVISRGGGPATGWLFLVGQCWKRPVTAFFTASAAPATTPATAASTTALALLVFTVTPWCGIGLAAVARVSLGSLANGTLPAGLVDPVTTAPLTT